MNLKQLQYFVAVAQEGSISGAAKRLFLTQPPLSAQIRSLEDEMGCALLERSSSGISLTGAGKILYRHAERLLEMSQVAKDEVMRSVSPDSGVLRVGMVSSLLCSVGMDWLHAFSRAHPKVRFEIFEGDTYELLERLRASTIHVAVLRTPFAPERLCVRTMSTDAIMAVGERRFLGDDDRPIALEALAKLPLILYRRWEQVVRGWFRDREIPFEPYCINDDARTTLAFAAKGMGVGIAPQSAAIRLKAPEITARRIEAANNQSDIVVVHNAAGYMEPCAQAFLRFVEEAL